MSKLKLSAVADETPVKLQLELPATVHRDLVAYGELLGKDGGVPLSQRSSSRRCSLGS